MSLAEIMIWIGVWWFLVLALATWDYKTDPPEKKELGTSLFAMVFLSVPILLIALGVRLI